MAGKKPWEMFADPEAKGPWTKFAEPEEEAKPAGFSLKDLALSLGQGVGGGAQAITDITGANNVVS